MGYRPAQGWAKSWVCYTCHLSSYRENQQNNVYWWRYCIRLENLGEATVQLRERNWRIFSLSGTLETVRGRGVVGQVRQWVTCPVSRVLLQEPVLSRDQPAFQYSSHVSLQAPSGHMWWVKRKLKECSSFYLKPFLQGNFQNGKGGWTRVWLQNPSLFPREQTREPEWPTNFRELIKIRLHHFLCIWYSEWTLSRVTLSNYSTINTQFIQSQSLKWNHVQSPWPDF